MQATAPLIEQPLEHFTHVMDTNCTGAVRMMQATAPGMIRQVSALFFSLSRHPSGLHAPPAMQHAPCPAACLEPHEKPSTCCMLLSTEVEFIFLTRGMASVTPGWQLDSQYRQRGVLYRPAPGRSLLRVQGGVARADQRRAHGARAAGRRRHGCARCARFASETLHAGGNPCVEEAAPAFARCLA